VRGTHPTLTWLHQANRPLAQLITQYIGQDWVTELSHLKKLIPLADDQKFSSEFREIKHRNKLKLAAFIKKELGLEVNPHSMFDVQVKRLHEYKRQLLNLLHVITRYNHIRANPNPAHGDFCWQSGTWLYDS